MKEFRVADPSIGAQRRERSIRVLIWTLIFVLAAISVFAVYRAPSASQEVNTFLIWLVILVVVGVVIGAHVFALQLGLERFENDSVFMLTDNDVIRRTSGWPDVQIGFDEITTVYQKPGWLIVEADSRRRIAIPTGIQEFNSLRAELEKHCPSTPPPRSPLLKFLPSLAILFCWGIILFSKGSMAVTVAGAVLLLLIGWELVRFSRQLRGRPKRSAFLFLFSISWLAAAIVIILRIIRVS